MRRAWIASVGLILSAVTGLSAGDPPAGPSSFDAGAIIRDSATANGLCVGLGLDVDAAGALASGSRLFVQLVAPDDKAALNWLRTLDSAATRADVGVVSHPDNPLPYDRDVVNLLIVRGQAHCPPATEVRRVLAPGGAVAIIDGPPGFAADARKLGLAPLDSPAAAMFRKDPLPAAEDWGCMTGGPQQGNSLPRSTIEPTMTLRWRAGPRWQARDYHYDAFACGSGVLIYREITVVPGSVDQFRRVLIARDAYNGRELWRRVSRPDPRPMYGFKVGASVAVGEGRICVDMDGGLLVLDAFTGKPLFAPELAKPPRAMTICGKHLVFTGDGFLAVNSLADGKKLWDKTLSGRIVAAIKDDMIFAPDASRIVGFRLASGEQAWTYDTARDKHPQIAFRGGVFCTASAVHYTKADREKTYLFALEAETGRPIWDAEADNPKTVYPDVKDMEPGLGLIAFDDEIWFKFKKTARPKPGYTATMTCIDAATGQIKRRNVTLDNDSTHCWANKGAGDYLFYSRNLFLNRRTMEVTANGLVRSICAIGHIPAERELFMLPHNCRCSTLIRGVLAMGAPQKAYDFRDLPAPVPAEMGGRHAPQEDSPDDWPMYRGTPQRSCGVRSAIGARLEKKWESPVGSETLTQAVSAYGLVILADRERSHVVALDAESGVTRWTFPVGDGLSYPPTLHRGLCLLGTAGGWVWALDARTGQPVWKLRAAPGDCLIGGNDRFESRWPVVGDVLVQNGVGYVAAGRAGAIDGGVQVVAFDPATGRVAWRQAYGDAVAADLLVGTPAGNGFMMNARLLTPADHRLDSQSAELPGCLNIVLHSIGGIGTYAALDDYLNSNQRHQVSARRELLGDRRIAGINVAFNDKVSVATQLVPEKDPRLRLAPAQRIVAADVPKKTRWDLPAAGLHVDAMAVAPGMIYWVGGSPVDDPRAESALQVWSADDGKCLQSIALGDRPIPDGLSIAGGRLFVVTRSGKVICFQGRP
ncbi:MAG: Outer membrane protein assembly factor BamB [Phycisphaerae bacterium]|nr:Outer membrane protein assembly factor BamB [Phycisphaerae bacterium]